jgi:hypothetical protein
VPTEVGDGRHRQRERRRTLAAQMHESQKLSQTRECVIDAPGGENTASQCSVTTQILGSHGGPASRSVSKLPREVSSDYAERGGPRAIRKRTVEL